METESVETKKRGRKKKIDLNSIVDFPVCSFPYEKVSESDPISSKDLDIALRNSPSDATLRDCNGLIKNLEYKYDCYGFIDWRAMINPKHIVLNRNSVARAGYVYESLSELDKDKFLTDWSDDKKIIKLAGFKEVARLRGYQTVVNKVDQVSDKVICHCTIEWIPNREGRFCYTAAASASIANVSPDYSQALEAIACNRAFARSVRESLNIHIVSDEELDQNKIEEVSNKSIPATHPRSQLIKKCSDVGVEFPAVKTMIQGLGLDNEDIISFGTVPIPTAMAILDIMRRS